MIIYSIKLNTDHLYFFFNDLVDLYENLLNKIKNDEYKKQLSDNICDIYREFIKQLTNGNAFHTEEQVKRIINLLMTNNADENKIEEIKNMFLTINRTDLFFIV